MEEKETTRKKGLKLSGIRLGFIILMPVLIILTVCPLFVVTFGDFILEADALSVFTGWEWATYGIKVAAEPLVIVTVLIPLVLLVLLVIDKIKDPAMSGILLGGTVADLLVWIIFRANMDRAVSAVSSSAAGKLTFSVTPWYIAALGLMMVAVVFSVLYLILALVQAGRNSGKQKQEKKQKEQAEEKKPAAAPDRAETAPQAAPAFAQAAEGSAEEPAEQKETQEEEQQAAGQEDAEEVIGFCVNCGAPLVRGFRFCTVCGAPVAEELYRNIEAEEKQEASAGETAAEETPERPAAAEEVPAEDGAQTAEQYPAEEAEVPEEATVQEAAAVPAEAAPEDTAAQEETAVPAEAAPAAQEAPAAEAPETETPAAEESPRSEPVRMRPAFCVNCGSRLGQDEKFCTVCGNKVELI